MGDGTGGNGDLKWGKTNQARSWGRKQRRKARRAGVQGQDRTGQDGSGGTGGGRSLFRKLGGLCLVQFPWAIL